MGAMMAERFMGVPGPGSPEPADPSSAAPPAAL